MAADYSVRAIGMIHSPWTEAKGTPIQGAFEPEVTGTVDIYPEFVDGLDGVEGFSHLWLLYLFHRSSGERLVVKPFMDENERGVFSTRAPTRPNGIGLSSVRLLRREDSVLHIAELDMLDGTPLLDVKPYVARFDRRDSPRQGWLEQVDHDRRTYRADDRFDESSE